MLDVYMMVARECHVTPWIDKNVKWQRRQNYRMYAIVLNESMTFSR